MALILATTGARARQSGGELSVAATSGAESMVFSKRISPRPGTPERESFDRVTDVVRRYELGELTAYRIFVGELAEIASPCLAQDDGAACRPAAAKAIFELALFRIDTDYAARDISARFLSNYESEAAEGEAPAPDDIVESQAKGLPLLEQLLIRFPDSPYCPFALYLLAYELRVSEQLKLSSALLQRFLKEHPDHGYAPAASLLLGHNLYELGEFGQAAKAYESAASKGGDTNEDHEMALYRLGWCRLRLSDYPGALEALLPLALRANEPARGGRRFRRTHFPKEARNLAELALADLDWDGDGQADFGTATEFLARARRLLTDNGAQDEAESLLKKAEERLGDPEKSE